MQDAACDAHKSHSQFHEIQYVYEKSLLTQGRVSLFLFQFVQNNFLLLSAQQHFFALMLCRQFDEAAAKARSIHLAYLDAAGEGHATEVRWRDMEKSVWCAANDEGRLAAFFDLWQSPFG